MVQNENKNFSIYNSTKGKTPVLPFVELKDAILGKKYNLSIAFVGPKESQQFNLRFRKKNKPTNILSFTLTDSSGELVICMKEVDRGVKDYGKTKSDFLGFLVIHGMLHLKGMEHGSTMESEEKKFCLKFDF